MTVKHVTELCEHLERYLGDPLEPTGRLSFARVLDADEREQYPFELISELQRSQVHEYCLPEEWGGRAGDVEAGFQLLRLVARRDPTTATTLMLTDLAFMPAWVAGTTEQRVRWIDAIKHGARMAWGLSEREHGSDLLANEMRAVKVPGGWRLTGEKYLIGNATVADVIAVHACTSERRGPGDWSIFMVDKHLCPAGSVEPLPNERLHGLRALDLSGIRLNDVFVSDDAMVGPQGSGLEVAIKCAQVARTTIASMAMGAVDTSLRVTMDFVVDRVIFGQRVMDVPYSRRQLSECFADLLLADAVSTGAVRGLQANPGQVSILSSATKYFVPTLLERTMAQLSVVLGARLYLRSDPRYGIYQKMLRDVLVAIFADGNTVVNLRNIASQLTQLLSAVPAVDDNAADPQRARRLALMFDIDSELEPWRPSQQQLFSRGGDDVTAGLSPSIAVIRRLAAREPDSDRARWWAACADAGDRILGELRDLAEQNTALRARMGRAYGPSAELFRLAERYGALHAGAAAIHFTAHSHQRLADPFPDPAVLLLMLERVWRHVEPRTILTDVPVIDQVMDVLLRLHREGRLFSPWQFQLSTDRSST
ncbi:MAG TPA: acyl-CoA dehydrogenase family protein [Micromonosporaceae bacterium]|nr:acyl-CoA dehydrogenase family protein [Micromonosporaceae bacterium]